MHPSVPGKTLGTFSWHILPFHSHIHIISKSCKLYPTNVSRIYTLLSCHTIFHCYLHSPTHQHLSLNYLNILLYPYLPPSINPFHTVVNDLNRKPMWLCYTHFKALNGFSLLLENRTFLTWPFTVYSLLCLPLQLKAYTPYFLYRATLTFFQSFFLPMSLLPWGFWTPCFLSLKCFSFSSLFTYSAPIHFQELYYIAIPLRSLTWSASLN